LKAAILTELNQNLVVANISLPNVLDVGQVLVRVFASGICGAQIGEITGAKGPDKYLPHLLGHEGGGVVEKVGPGVTTVKKGDHVCLHWRKGEGINAIPPKYKLGSETVGGGWVTTFNEMAVISENRLTKVPSALPFEISALLGCAVTTGFGLINNEAQLKIGQSIAVAGCGGVGLNVVQGAKLVCADKIFGIDIHDSKLEMAMRFGATHLINSSIDQEFIIDEINKSTSGKGVDVFVDCTGVPEIIDMGLHLSKKLILVGQPKIGVDYKISNARNMYTGKTIIDSQGGLTNPTVDIPRYAALYLNGKINLEDLIIRRFPLSEVNKAIEMVKLGKVGRCILEMN